jgi:hypothetical protein
MNDETISRAQLLLQYYAALSELEQEGLLAASHQAKTVRAGYRSDRVDRMQPMIFEKEMRVSA